MCAHWIEFFRKVNGLKIRPEFFELIWLPDMMIMSADTNEARMDPMEPEERESGVQSLSRQFSIGGGQKK